LKHEIVELRHQRTLIRARVIVQRFGPFDKNLFSIRTDRLIVSSMNSLKDIALGSSLLFIKSVCTRGGTISRTLTEVPHQPGRIHSLHEGAYIRRDVCN
jgi:hypothetical protein